MPIWQLCANLLIPNCLCSNLSYSPLAALELYVKKTKAYGNEYYDGNLLDILDNRFQRVINIPNNKLNELIYKKMKCDKNCAKCGYCKDLYTTIQNEFV